MTNVENIAEAVRKCRDLGVNRSLIFVFPHTLGTEEMGMFENQLREIPAKEYVADDNGDYVVVMRVS